MSAPDIPALLPCPFCGAAAFLEYDEKHGYFGPDADHAGNCPISLDFRDYADEHQAIREWNTRATPKHPHTPDVAGLVERLRSESVELQKAAWGRLDGGQAAAVVAKLTKAEAYSLMPGSSGDRRALLKYGIVSWKQRPGNRYPSLMPNSFGYAVRAILLEQATTDAPETSEMKS